MPVWLVRTTWNEDETEANEQWEVNAETAHEAVEQVTTRLRFAPHHVEARLCSPDDTACGIDLQPGQVRRHPAQLIPVGTGHARGV
jgi:hypothetical protein